MNKIFLILFVCIRLQAATLLVPSDHSDFKDYKSHCRNNDYVCTNDYFANILIEKATPQFDSQMDNLDLSSKKSVAEFRNCILGILNSEMLSTSQLNMLITVLRQINADAPDYLFRQVQLELESLSKKIASAAAPPESEFVLLFKQKISVATAKNARTAFLKIPLYRLHFSSVPRKANTRDFSETPPASLLNGQCLQAKLNVPIARIAWVAYDSENCAMIPAVETTNLISENKNMLWWAGLTSVAVLIANNYEFSFNF